MKKTIVLLSTVLLNLPSFGAGTVGDAVTTFQFAGQPKTAEWYNGYLQSFYTNRIDIGPTMFPREYLAIADSWLNDAQREQFDIQQFTRKGLLESQMDDEGYLWAQQHGASSHDHGWPFPHWIQAPDWKGSIGVTAGWHFYDNPRGWEILYRHVRDVLPSRVSLAAANSWELSGFESKGINQQKNAWELKAVGGFPTITSPADVTLDAFNCPFIQIRWNVGEKNASAHQPYMEWMREGDSDWSESRRMDFYPDWLKGRSEDTGMFHSMLPLCKHPEWSGKITRIRFCMDSSDAPPETFYVRSIFSHWDTRHLVNNAIYIKAAFEYFRWTGDVDFLRQILPRLRLAMRYMMEEGHGLELDHIRCTWHGHDGRPGYTVHPDGTKTFHVGHGKGGNYWDLLPIGWDDMYTTTHYYASLLAMAQIEEAIARNPGWAMPGGVIKDDPAFLRGHAQAVKENANRTFWNEKDGRFVSCIDADGIPHDYGFTFVNLEAIHYGIASESNAVKIMEWIDGDRVVEGDTSIGADIYTYRLAPRATTKRNVDWYAHAWTGPETLPFGGQVQDGGAVLGFSFYDVMSRIKTLGSDNAWKRLMGICDWDAEVAAYGGYRKYYGDGKGGTTLQGG
ncbi:MAG: hypothetical protein K9M54_10025, partial [Kiritimatiellales bacterium]|nr:hypothetical protein [Kiritimatiellales bacterium]